MKKYIAFIMALAMVLLLAGCAEYTSEEKEILCKVVSCDDGKFVPNPTYTVLATKAFADGDVTKSIMYNNLAQSTGKYEYKVVVIIEGTEYTLTRSEPYKEGDEILVKQNNSYCNGELIETIYN